jgi:hypothetical protein
MTLLPFSGRGLATALAVIAMVVMGACSSKGGDAPNGDGKAADTGGGGPAGGGGDPAARPDAGEDAASADAAADVAVPDAAGDAHEPGCADACAKAYACGLVSSPDGCVCSGKSASPECIACWLSHTCKQISEDYVCYDDCN